MCHGGGDDQTGAPPRATWGNAADPVRTGAHRAHVQGTAISPAVACNVCHVNPPSALTAGHVDVGPAEVVFGGPAVGSATPTWDRAGATCAGTACHARPGAANPAPRWTRVGQGETACGACHGLPPPAPAHPAVSSDLTGCKACHDATIDAAGAIIAPASGGKHLDGVVEAGGHPATWMATGSEGFHAYAANRGLDECRSCHGANLDGAGGSARGCQACHGESWQTRCTMCHGGTADQSGAPPRTVWGKSGDPVRVGAHAAHLAPSASHAAIACAVCHPVPASATTAGHVDARDTADVALTGLATAGLTAAWNRGAATCATYCHGPTLGSGSNTVPVWTGGPAQAACGSCHGAPPPSGGHWHYDYGAATCGDCHGFGYYSFGDAALHVNGARDVGGNVVDWVPAAGGSGTCTSVCHDQAVW
jgi:predicted CxxxxCH...CXXCH cytochrome family protein